MYRQSFNLAKKYANPASLGQIEPTFFLPVYMPVRYTKSLTSVKLMIGYQVFVDFSYTPGSFFKFNQNISFQFQTTNAEYGGATIQPKSTDITAFTNEINNQIVYNPDGFLTQPNTQMYRQAEIELLPVTFKQNTFAPTFELGISGVLDRTPELFIVGNAFNFSQSGTGLTINDIKMIYKAQVIVEAREPTTALQS